MTGWVAGPAVPTMDVTGVLATGGVGCVVGFATGAVVAGAVVLAGAGAAVTGAVGLAGAGVAMTGAVVLVGAGAAVTGAMTFVIGVVAGVPLPLVDGADVVTGVVLGVDGCEDGALVAGAFAVGVD